MPRRKTPPAEPQAARAEPRWLQVPADSVWLAADFLAAFHLRKSTLRREINAGRLKVCKRAGRYFLLGRDIHDWLASGRHEPRKQATGLA